MYALAPLRIPATGADLFILPLVDRRYFALTRSHEIFRVHSYREMLRDIGRGVGLPTRLRNVSINYGKPDPMFQETMWPACAFLDVMALSLGTRRSFIQLGN